MPDKLVRINLEKIPNVPCRLLALREDPRITDYLNAYQKQRLADQLGDLQFQLGYRCEAQFAKAEGLGYVGFKVSEKDGEVLHALIVQHEQALQRLREADAALDQIV